MIYLKKNRIKIEMPDVHKNAKISINLQRTLRLPDDGTVYSLPPGLGKFPLRHIEDYDLGRNQALKKRGGLIMPMFQADALWISFDTPSVSGHTEYPFAVKIATGKICAISGDSWNSQLMRDPQNYVVTPDQPWLDGYNVARGRVKQFVAAPLGQGYTAEEQITGSGEVGGIQIQIIPMKKEVYKTLNEPLDLISFCKSGFETNASCDFDMGLAPGGEMRQEIYDDPHDFSVWDLRKAERFFITIANAEQWMEITGEEPPLEHFTTQDYTMAGLPWFDYYSQDKAAIDGAERLGKLKSVKQIKPKKGDNFWVSDPNVGEPKVVTLGKKVISSGSW